MATTDYFWAIFPILAWGIGVAFHGIQVFSSEWEDAEVDREYERLKKKRGKQFILNSKISKNLTLYGKKKTLSDEAFIISFLVAIFAINNYIRMPYKFEPGSRRKRIHEIIFEADTVEGKVFDIILLGMILLSIIVVSWETIATFKASTKHTLYVLEWIMTIFFTIEYILRISSVSIDRGNTFSAFMELLTFFRLSRLI